MRVVLLSFLFVSSLLPKALAFTNADLIEGFNGVVFGSEYNALPLSQIYVRKWTKPVRVFVEPGGSIRQRDQISRFLKSLPKRIENLRLNEVSRRSEANFFVFPVRRRSYSDTIRKKVYRNPNAVVRGRCIVRVRYSRRGIQQSQAVIVTDEGQFLFQRCMTEEILQGLGPLNDDPTLRYSIFNDRSKFSRFQTYDRIILNALYDTRIQAGMSLNATSHILPAVIRDTVLRLGKR